MINIIDIIQENQTMLSPRQQSLGDIRDGVVYLSGGKIQIIFQYYCPATSPPLIATSALWFIVWSIRWILTQICRVISQVIVVAVLAEINDAGIKDYIDVFIDTEK